ncbi:MAG TPA: aldehyde dehydrogenase family protein [Streptosporangiaceae bacterium]|jgi:acyl-CoA reductase-like NAD-dependent aldehyde dehydrogenase
MPDRGPAKASRAKASPAKAGPAGASEPVPRARLDVRKTYKLFIGGVFPRSESGRSYPVRTPGGDLLAYAAQASRKDARDAVVAARRAVSGWSGATAYNRGQVLYRVAEMLEGRAGQFAAEVAAAEGLTAMAARARVAAAIDRWVWYAGWPDKLAQVAGAVNPVAGPYVNFSLPEPVGVVAVLAPAASSLLGLVSVLAPVIATGNAAVVAASQDRPLPAATLAEVLATSDVPAGVVNLLTGYQAELAPVLAGHQDVDAIDLAGAAPASAADLERLAAGNLKRVLRAQRDSAGPDAAGAAGTEPDWAASPGTSRMLAFTEIKTVWHPAGI